MILTGDYHTHTPYSHGKSTVDENARRAKELGLKQVGITDHGYTHISFGLRRREIEAYKAECRAAAEKYGIDVLVGIEANIQGVSGKSDLTEKDFEDFDLYLCGKHAFIWFDRFVYDTYFFGAKNYVFEKLNIKPSKGMIRRNTQAYVNAIMKNPLDAITHINFYCPADPVEVAKCAADYGTYIELNSKKTHLTDEELMNIVAKTSARFIINSDAHNVERVGEIKLVEEQLSRLDFPLDRIDNVDGRTPSFRFAEFKKHM